jgi:hypothetical protein
MKNPFENCSKEELVNLCFYQQQEIRKLWLFYRFCVLVVIISLIGIIIGVYVGK